MRRFRLLVVDDSEEVRVTLKIAVDQLGHSAEIVDCAETALERFDSGRFDAVITDLYLPGMDGDQLARLIKRQDAEIPIILLTAYPPARLPDDIDTLLVKPFNVQNLSEALQNARGQALRR